MASFFLVPEGQNVHRVIQGIVLVAVESHLAGIPKGNDQLAQLWRVRQGTANIRTRLQQHEVLFNGLACPLCSFRSLGSQKTSTSFQALHGTFGNDYLRHSGAGSSSSVPQVLNQLLTSLPERWRPLSL